MHKEHGSGPTAITEGDIRLVDCRGDRFFYEIIFIADLGFCKEVMHTDEPVEIGPKNSALALQAQQCMYE